MDNYLAGLATEGVNPETRGIDACSTEEMVALINRQDALVAGAVGAEGGRIAQAVDLIYQCLRRGGRLSALQAGLGAVTKLKPVITVRDGAVAIAGKSFGAAAAVSQPA